MKIVVSYACELEDIPFTVVELLQNLKENHLPGIEIDIQDAILNSNENKISDALESLDAARVGLGKLDNRLIDYMSILAGYSKTNADLHLGVDPFQTTNEDNNVDTETKETDD